MSDAARLFHEAWLGLVQPTEGLVVSLSALIEADCFERLGADRVRQLETSFQTFEVQAKPDSSRPAYRPNKKASVLSKPATSSSASDNHVETHVRIADLLSFLRDGLGWDTERLDTEPPADLSFYSPEGPQTISPTAAYRRLPHQTRHSGYSISAGPLSINPSARIGKAYAILVWDLQRQSAAEAAHGDAPLSIGEGIDLDKPETLTGAWEYPPSKKFERLLRESRVPIGLLHNGEVLRLVYAPHGESVGHIDFRAKDMHSVGGRPILEALVMLLSEERLSGVAEDRQLSAILKRSREMQAEVTTDLARQVFGAAEILLQAFEAANSRSKRTVNGVTDSWLAPLLTLPTYHDDPNSNTKQEDPIYESIVTVLLRLVFLLYAEDNNLLPTDDPKFSQHYSIYALFDRLTQDRARNPEGMNRRYAAWPGLLALFRAVYFGVSHGDLQLPPREGHLFDPERFPWLEGRSSTVESENSAETYCTSSPNESPPTIDDESIYNILKSLIYLRSKGGEGQRLSYRTLQVEQIGAVYEGLMGFRVEQLNSPSVRIKPSENKHEPTWVSVRELLAQRPSERADWLEKMAGVKGKPVTEALNAIAALEKKHTKRASSDDAINRELTESVFEELLALRRAMAKANIKNRRTHDRDQAHPGRLILQPGQERKRTSSHYTPQALSGPIVQRALDPLLRAFGESPTSEQILSLRVCDPAMGSGAFLVEACRYLGDRLLGAWTREGKVIAGDPAVYARRQIAERCLYGVDKNSFAVELGKLSLWLVTLQKEKSFTFLDHNLRAGDSLVGCSLEQIRKFHWNPNGGSKKGDNKQLDFFSREVRHACDEAHTAYARLTELAEQDTPESRRDMATAMRDADDALSRLRIVGDVLLGAFFERTKDKDREQERARRLELVWHWLADEKATEVPKELQELADRTRESLHPFHWPVEFSTVLNDTGASVDVAGFDSFIGNPPFAGKNSTANQYGEHPILDWFKVIHEGAHGNADLCAHFFRRAHNLLKDAGTIGFVATNTIAQGDTRATALQALVKRGTKIYDANDSIPWPGDAAVTISTVHLVKGTIQEHIGDCQLGGGVVACINSRLRSTPERADPVVLPENASMSFQGTVVLGMGFTLTPDERDALIKRNPRNAERIFPYLGGEEVNTSPTQAFDRYVINFGNMSLEEAEQWPDLIDIVRTKVKPERDKNKRDVRRKYWWRFGELAPALYAAIAPLDRCLVNSQVSKHLVCALQPVNRIFGHALNVFALDKFTAFAILQSRIHERWARLLGSSMKTDLRYTATDCFQTFPFPDPSPAAVLPELEALGERLYETRAQFMVDTGQGLTQTYNALKDPTITLRHPHGPRIEELRQLHIDLDHAVLQAYATQTSDPSWLTPDIPPFTTPQTEEEKHLHQQYEDHILDHLFALNEQRVRR